MDKHNYAIISVIISLILFAVLFALLPKMGPNIWTALQCCIIGVFFVGIYIYLKKTDESTEQSWKSYYYERYDLLTSSKEVKNNEIINLLKEAFSKFNIMVDSFGKNFMRIRNTNLQTLFPKPSEVERKVYSAWFLLKSTIDTLYWSMGYLLPLNDDIFTVFRNMCAEQIDFDNLITNFSQIKQAYSDDVEDGTIDVLKYIQKYNIDKQKIVTLYFFFNKTNKK